MPNTTADLKKFAQAARRQLREQVAGRLEQVLRTDSAALREKETALRELRQAIAQSSSQAVIDRVAYTWFNRLCALRFMDANHYTSIAVVSPAEGFSQPEILQEAKKGYIDDALTPFLNRQTIFDLLGGRRPSADPQQEAYRMLLVAVCNAYNAIMPFLFEPIEDYTELLMPLDLLSDSAVLHDLRATLTPEACQDVEVIGWLYQYYISERKDEVFEALKRNQKIEAQDIPAATQLFTPHWIVRYLVENSLGRLWLLNHPGSTLAEQMEYYIRPAQPESDFLQIGSPEEIKLCDPACGSGHMLTYAFDLLSAIYAEQGYPAAEIPGLILTHNLYGIEIDERAGGLAAFALFMKARSKDRRFFNRAVQPQICVLENIHFSDQELEEYMNAAGRDLFSEPLRETLKQFEEAKNFGSLIRPILTDAAFVRQMLAEKNLAGDLFLHDIHERVEKGLRQAEYLSPRYHVVVANPPYMGSKSMNDEIRSLANNLYPDSKSDLFAMFIERDLEFVPNFGQIAMITMQSWMFLTSYEELRKKIIKGQTIQSMIHLGPHAFDTIGGEVVSTTAFIVMKGKPGIGTYVRLVDGINEDEKAKIFLHCIHYQNSNKSPNFFIASSKEFNAIPTSPIAYWVSKRFIAAIRKSKELGELCPVKEGLNTGDNELFLRFWYEINKSDFRLGTKNREDAKASKLKWFPCNKGGGDRKWYGHNDYVINWFNDGANLFAHPNSTMRNVDYYFREGITWSGLSSSGFSGRYFPVGYIFNSAGRSMLPPTNELFYFIGLLNSKVGNYFFRIVAPTLSFTVGNIASMPVIMIDPATKEYINSNSQKIIAISKNDWDSFETSWEFSSLPILNVGCSKDKLAQKYSSLRNKYLQTIKEVKQFEEGINRICIEAYDLQDELTPDVPFKDVSLTCNPFYRYSGKKSEEELEALLLADTMREFISYAVGCMFGRYSLDKPGLILANQGESLQDYLRQIPNPSFLPDEDNAIPILDGDWFSDDITERFKKFLRVTFGEEHFAENLAFIESAIGRDIRGYFLKEFYGQHVKMYQKRPIYWLFSSPQGSFNVLIYMQRYTKDTLSVILNRYLREFRGKLAARKSYLEQISISASANPREKTGALKEMEGLNKKLEELRVYERDTLFPLAAQRVEIDLDDGVKVNYAKFGGAVAKIM